MQVVKRTEDDILYFVAYSPIRILVSWLINALGVCLVIMTTIEVIKDGKYGLGLVWAVISVALIALILDSFLTKGLYFYPDRIEKRWVLGFRRSIAYANAKIIGPPSEYKWLTSSYTVREINKDGKSSLWQLPILYISFFFPAQDQTKLCKIWEYLTQNKTDNPRFIKVPSICSETLQSL